MKALLVSLIPLTAGVFLLACNEASLRGSTRVPPDRKPPEAYASLPTVDSEAVNPPLPVTGS